MSNISKKIDDLLKLGLSPLLKTHKFKKKGRNWRKAEGPIFQIINVQASVYNIGLQGQFCINLGIYHQDIYNMLWGRVSQEPKESEALLHSRLNLLAYENMQWWEIDENTSLQTMSDDICRCMSEIGLPWLEQRFDIASISHHLSLLPLSREAVATAILTDDSEAAEQRLKEVISKWPEKEEEYTEWAKQYGINIRI